MLLLDVVLGYGAHPDPAGELAPAIAGGRSAVIVALCGAAGDPQDLDAQRRAAGGGRRGGDALQRAAARRAASSPEAPCRE